MIEQYENAHGTRCRPITFPLGDGDCITQAAGVPFLSSSSSYSYSYSYSYSKTGIYGCAPAFEYEYEYEYEYE